MYKHLYCLLVVFVGVFLFFSCVGGKYTYVKLPEVMITGKSDNFNQEELQTEDYLKRACDASVSAEYLGDFFRKAFLVVEDMDNIAFTVEIKDGKTTISRGIKPNDKADITISMTRQNCENIYHIFEDGQISEEEKYRMTYVTFVPMMRAQLQNDDLYNPQVAKALALPNHIQIVLTNQEKYLYNNSIEELKISIVNVDGQWLVYKGFAGVPDVRVAVTADQAIEYTKLIMNPLKEGHETIEEQKEKLAKIQSFFKDYTVFKRN